MNWKRIVIYICGVLTLGLGLVLSSKAGIGMSPIMSVPYTLSVFTNFTFGTWTTIVYCIFTIVEMIEMRRFDIRVILQLPFSWLFGKLVDFYNLIIPIKDPSLPIAIVIFLLSVVCIALGVVMMLSMDLIVNPADGFVSSMSRIFHTDFGKAKMCTDFCMALTTVILLVFFVHHLEGIGIGTLIAVFAVGPACSFFTNMIGKKLKQIAGMEN